MLTQAEELQEFKELESLIMTKYEIENYRSLVWHTCAHWAIPLPEYKVNGYFISRHFIPDEAPVIPTGWIYEIHDGRYISEALLDRMVF